MLFSRFLAFACVIVFSTGIFYAQEADSTIRIRACVSNEKGIPLAWTHVINLCSGRGTTSDSSGNFSLTALKTDSVLFRNVSCYERIIAARDIYQNDTVILTTRFYAIKEVKIFEWGSTYADFKAKMKSMPVTQSMGEKLGLPQQSGNPVPNYRNAEILNNPMFAISNPVDFLYYNFDKKQQSIRKVMEFKQNEDLIRRFESVYNRAGIEALTGLSGKELDDFMMYLNLHFRCDFRCSEIQVATEIYEHWKNYRDNLP